MQILAQSQTIQRVPYAHVGYTAAANDAAMWKLGTVIVPALVLLTAFVSAAGMIGTGVVWGASRNRNPARCRKWRTAFLVCTGVFIIAAGLLGFCVLAVVLLAA